MAFLASLKLRRRNSQCPYSDIAPALLALQRSSLSTRERASGHDEGAWREISFGAHPTSSKYTTIICGRLSRGGHLPDQWLTEVGPLSSSEVLLTFAFCSSIVRGGRGNGKRVSPRPPSPSPPHPSPPPPPPSPPTTKPPP